MGERIALDTRRRCASNHKKERVVVLDADPQFYKDSKLQRFSEILRSEFQSEDLIGTAAAFRLQAGSPFDIRCLDREGVGARHNLLLR